MADEEKVVRDLLPIARSLVKGPRIRRAMPAGYGIKPGEKVLIAINNMYDEVVVKAIVQAIREAGATVDIISCDMGPDRYLEYIDEMNGLMHNWKNIKEENPARWWGFARRWVEKLAEEQKYDLLVYGTGGPLPPKKGDNTYKVDLTATPTSYDYEGIPWITREMFLAAKFPFELWALINRRAWEKIWSKSRGGRGRLTDPEGTDISWTFWDEYFDPNHYMKTGSAPRDLKEPLNLGHLYGRNTAPFLPKDDAEGVVAGTTNHIGRPFPPIRAIVKKNQIVEVEGGGGYGDLVRGLLNDTKDIKYPEYPEKGFLYWWELAIGTNPKMVRPSNCLMLSGSGTLSERLRSGMIHMGFGTVNFSPSEIFGKENNITYGHIHIHLMFANFEITTKKGEVIKVIDKGRLTVLDDPEVIEKASKFGDPKELLRDDWIAPVPGISVPGDYHKDYAQDPFTYIKNYHASKGKTSA